MILCKASSLINEVCPHNFSFFFSIFDLGIREGGLMRNMCLLWEVLPNFFFLGTNLKILNNKAHQLHSPQC